MTVLLGISVLVGVVVGVAEIVRDLVIDRQLMNEYQTIDWFWMYPCEEHFRVPPEMFFFRESEDIDFWVDTGDDACGLIYFGYNPDDLADILHVGELLSDEGSKPLFIDLGSRVADDVRTEYRMQSMQNRDFRMWEPTKAAIA